MNEQLRVQVEIMLPQWYVEKHALPQPFVGQLEVSIPDAGDDSIENLVRAMLDKMRGDLCAFLRAAAGD